MIPGTAKTGHIFADDRKKIEGLRQGNPSLFERGGEHRHAHSGEEYRQELRKGIERWDGRINTWHGASAPGSTAEPPPATSSTPASFAGHSCASC